MTTNDIVIVLGLLENAREDAAALEDSGHAGGTERIRLARARLASIRAVSLHLKRRLTDINTPSDWFSETKTETLSPAPVSGTELNARPKSPLLREGLKRICQTTPLTVEHQFGDSWFKVEDKLPDPGVEVLAFTFNMGGSVEVAYTEKREPPDNHSNWRSPGFTWFKTIKGTAMGDLKVELPCVTRWKPLPDKG
jgi:hypothetical protein